MTMIHRAPVDIVMLNAIDDMLRLTELVRAEKPRDPLRRLEDVLLDMRAQVTR